MSTSPSARVPVGQMVPSAVRSINLDLSNGDTSRFSGPKTIGFA